MLRHIGVHKLVMSLLTLEAGTDITEDIKMVFEDCYIFLQMFCENNPRNQVTPPRLEGPTPPAHAPPPAPCPLPRARALRLAKSCRWHTTPPPRPQ